MSEFSDRPFVAGNLTGLRSFSVDSLGRLTGVSHQEVWKPGANEAKCMRGAESVLRASVARLSYSLNYGGAIQNVTPPTKPREHTLAGVDCTCGFYAYFDNGDNPYHDTTENILGVIQGSGVATVGTRGFRASKAEIVGFIIPERKTASSRWHEFCDWAQVNRWTVPVGVAGIVSGFLGSFITITSATAGELPPWSIAIAIPLLIAGAILFRAHDVGFKRYLRRKYPQAHGLRGTGPKPEVVELVRRNYPDVPVYPSVDAALDAHPLTFVPKPSPETDEDFWTRSAS